MGVIHAKILSLHFILPHGFIVCRHQIVQIDEESFLRLGSLGSPFAIIIRGAIHLVVFPYIPRHRR